jgi:hypothetical protein
VYDRTGLTNDFHTVEQPLEPGTTYLWSVRSHTGDKFSAWACWSRTVVVPGVAMGSVNNEPFGFQTPGSKESTPTTSDIVENEPRGSFIVDPEFAKSHNLEFKQPQTKSKVVLFYQKDHIRDNLHKESFLDAMKNCGVFSEVAVANKQQDLQKYPGWDVIRVNLTDRLIHKGLVVSEELFEVKIRFEFQMPSEPVEYVYSSGLWNAFRNAQISEPQPLMILDHAQKLIAKELLLAALSEAQRSGRYFQ